MQPNWKWYVYIIECMDGSYYTGMTWKPSERWDQHAALTGCEYTKLHPPKKLVHLEEYENLETTRLREQQIKKWSRKKKEELITGRWHKDW